MLWVIICFKQSLPLTRACLVFRRNYLSTALSKCVSVTKQKHFIVVILIKSNFLAVAEKFVAQLSPFSAKPFWNTYPRMQEKQGK